MVKRSVRAYVELAAGLGEVTRSKAVEAAQEIVHLAGTDESRKKVAKQVGRVAEDLMRAAEHNRAHVASLVQREVESAVARVDLGRLLAEVQSLGSAVAGLAAQVDDLARATGMRVARTPSAAVADLAEPALATPPVFAATTTRRPAAKKASPAKKAAAKKAGPVKKAAVKKASPVKKAAAKKAAAKKAGPVKKATGTASETGA